MENSILKRRLAKIAGSAGCALLLLGGVWGMSSCSDDLLVGTPSWLGSSIYEELESRGNFKTTLALINDPVFLSDEQKAKGETETEYAKTLKRTGSRTVFVADDDAWQRYFKKKGISGLEQMSAADKKMLFKSSMVNSAYLIELLSSVQSVNDDSDPVYGSAMRRMSLLDPFDRVPVVTPAEFPPVLASRTNTKGEQLDYWSHLRGRDQILLLKDENSQPMVHFLPAFMSNNNITNDDYAILTNGVSNDVSKSYINGQPVVEQDITCQNGYIHVLGEVPEPLENMAETVNTKPELSLFASMLDRFSYPEYNASASATYNSLYNLNSGRIDSVFVKRYFNNATNNKHDREALTNTTATVLLPFDPGWNKYTLPTYSNNTNIYGADPFPYDAAAMFVPTNKALEAFFDASPLRERYNNWDEVPDNVVYELVNNHMKAQFTTAVPSKFGNVNNSEGERLGITVEDVDSSFVCNNGVIYQVHTVFNPQAYISVSFPAMVRRQSDLSVMGTSIESKASTWTLQDYKAYLTSAGSKYSFFIPNDEAFKKYLDPVSMNRSSDRGGAVQFSFYIDPEKPDIVSARAYKYDPETLEQGDLAQTNAQPNQTMVMNRLTDVMDNMIVVQSEAHPQFIPSQTIYLNKAGSPIVVEFEGDDISKVGGSGEMEKGELIPVDRIYDELSNGGNGKAYVISKIPTTTMLSPCAAIHDDSLHADFAMFDKLLSKCQFVKTGIKNGSSTLATMDRAIDFLNAYHYTIYVPTNESIQALIDAGKLPTWDEYDDWNDYLALQDTAYTKAEVDSFQTEIRNVIENFVRYHIHDNSVYLGGEHLDGQAYESQCRDTMTNRFRRLVVTNTGEDISVRDLKGNVRHVLKDNDGKDYNIMTRQYIFDGSTIDASRNLYNSSYVAIHKIDGPLLYADEQFLDPTNPLPKPVLPAEDDETPAGQVKRHKYSRK